METTPEGPPEIRDMKIYGRLFFNSDTWGFNVTVLSNQVHMHCGVWWFTICGFSFCSFMSFGQERSPKSSPQHVATVRLSKKALCMKELFE